MLDSAVARDQLRTSEIFDIGLVCCVDNFADGLTKSMQQSPFCTCIGNGKLVVKPVETIIRTLKNDSTKPMMDAADAH